MIGRFAPQRIDEDEGNGETPLLWAAKSGRDEAVQLLLELKRNMDAHLSRK